MSGTGFGRPAMPGQRVMVGWLAGALAGGSLLGLVIAVTSPPEIKPGTVSAMPAAASSPAPGRATATTPARPSPSPTKTKPVTTVTRSPAAVPATFIQHPDRDRSMFLGVLQSIDQNDHEHIMIYVRKAQVLSGAKAKQYYESKGQQPRNTAVVAAENADSQQFVLRGDAALWALQVLRGGDHRDSPPEPHQLGLDEFLGNANDALSHDEHPPVWIKRSLGLTGPVIYLAEHVSS